MTEIPHPGRKSTRRQGKQGRDPHPSGTDGRQAGEDALEKSLETLDALAIERKTERRIRRMPHDVAWLLITAGVVGLVTPGVLGLPFLAMGGLVLWPGTSGRIEHWLNGRPPRFLKGSMKQIGRFLDDLERRYPPSSR
ncbi:hypothetical protein [Methylococcus geothermalis]|uniref:Transmembrane protein n=1 Tax=Methylococcus geothermalis TaxID=2681310 RepID=A0A858QAY3_9GAMM|nr:hypothetical protein [Methylococcus geothermalis]QJD30864.1 hypothetical protein GNH96_13400 [Methylococcus geothermalis]